MHLRVEAALKTGAFEADTSHIERELQRWEVASKGLHNLRPTTTLEYMRDRYTCARRLDPASYDVSTFARIASSDVHWQARDRRGALLAYRYRVDGGANSPLIRRLSESSDALILAAPRAHTGTARGTFPVHHFAVWMRYAGTPYASADIERIRGAHAWLEANSPLFDQIGRDLALIRPDFSSLLSKTRAELARINIHSVAGAHLAVALNMGQTSTTVSRAHQDWSDATTGFNCVCPFGDYKGGDLILWPLKIVLELRPGDCAVFAGARILHSIEPITHGLRNSIDLFSHQGVLDWARARRVGAANMAKRRREGAVRARKKRQLLRESRDESNVGGVDYRVSRRERVRTSWEQSRLAEQGL